MRRPDVRQLIMEEAERDCVATGITDIRFVCSITLHCYIRADDFRHICGGYLYGKYYPQQMGNFNAVDMDETVDIGVTRHGEAVQVTAGETQAVHERTLAAIYRDKVMDIDGQADILILAPSALGSYTKDTYLNPLLVNTYALGYYYNMYVDDVPLLKEGGCVIVEHDMQYEWSSPAHDAYRRLFEEVLAVAPGLDEFERFQQQFVHDKRLNDIYRRGLGPAAVHGIYMYTWAAHGMDKVGKVYVVGAKDPRGPAVLCWEMADTTQDAVDQVMPHAMPTPMPTPMPMPMPVPMPVPMFMFASRATYHTAAFKPCILWPLYSSHFPPPSLTLSLSLTSLHPSLPLCPPPLFSPLSALSLRPSPHSLIPPGAGVLGQQQGGSDVSAVSPGGLCARAHGGAGGRQCCGAGARGGTAGSEQAPVMLLSGFSPAL
ncbi:unnamed protein product [Closterium sp. NIES-54]